MKKYAKITALLMAFVLVIAGTVGVTMALLTDKTVSVENTFTIGKVDIDLTESTNTYKLIPGSSITKDPKVTVKEGSEACWLFVQLDVETALDAVLNDFSYVDGWAVLNNHGLTVAGANTIVIYKQNATVGEYGIFTENKLYVDTNATTALINAATDKTLTVTAYAVQAENVTTVDAAWAAAKTAAINP